jgi:hypothetical protein
MQVVRERAAWIAVTSVLATSLAWLAVASLALAAGSWARPAPEALAVLRALSHAALALGRLGAPAALAALAGAGILLAAALPGDRGQREKSHVRP